jgi:hypothetical protein
MIMKNYILLILISTVFSISSFAQNLSQGNVFDGEPFLAVNPYNSGHLVVAWMGFTSIQQRFQIKTKTSFDGGKSWSSTQFIPHEVVGYSSADPCIDFNKNGEPYLCYIDFTGTQPPVTGGIYVRKSKDGGLSWEAAKEVVSTSFDSPKWPIDRPWIKINRYKSPEEIYVTSMNLNRTSSPYNPYISYSSDGGNTFVTRYLDSTNWLAGSLIPTPMCSPTVATDGTFYGSYPSFVLSQALYAQSILAKTNDIKKGFTYSALQRLSGTGDDNYENAKKAGLLINNPANANHLAAIGLKTTFGNLDVFYSESLDGGATWSAEIKVNDAPNSNQRMQDMVWADFDLKGNLVISWRDRRNGSDSSYQNPIELWAAYKHKDSSSFSSNFKINKITTPYDSTLAASGNDFHTSLLINDTIHSVWGEMQTGKLNIWYYRTLPNGQLVSVKNINQIQTSLNPYPNPCNGIIHITNDFKGEYYLINSFGQTVLKGYKHEDNLTIDAQNLTKGRYWILFKNRSSSLTGVVDMIE